MEYALSTTGRAKVVTTDELIRLGSKHMTPAEVGQVASALHPDAVHVAAVREADQVGHVTVLFLTLGQGSDVMSQIGVVRVRMSLTDYESLPEWDGDLKMTVSPEGNPIV